MLSHDEAALFSQSGEAIKGAFTLYNMHTQHIREAGVDFVNDLVQCLPGGDLLPYLDVQPLNFAMA